MKINLVFIGLAAFAGLLSIVCALDGSYQSALTYSGVVIFIMALLYGRTALQQPIGTTVAKRKAEKIFYLVRTGTFTVDDITEIITHG